VTSDVYWIDAPFPGWLAILARPRGGDWLDDEIAGWRQAGLQAVVSLLEPAEATELGLDAEADGCRAAGIAFAALPMPDRGLPPDRAAFTVTVAGLAGRVAAGEVVGVHCRQGIGRSAVLAAGVLVELGLTPADTLARVVAARGRPVPETDAQRDWVLAFARTREPVVR
jgi:protein-tyrosine phosphatase